MSFRRALAALTSAAVLGLAAPAAAQEDPRIAQVRAGLAALAPLSDRPACPAGAEQSADPVISAHRGALELAPENTLWSYEYAFAYGVDLVEVDIQQTQDGRFVALHDSTVDRTTNGTGDISTLTFAEVRALNAADYAPWKGTGFDPAQVASVEEVLALAARVGGGLELDVKGSVTEEGELAELVEAYGLVEESIFNSRDPRILQAAPGANLIYNRDRFEPPALMREIASVFSVFGSRLDEYDAASIAAIHEGCGIVMPHAYDAGPDLEVAQYRLARSLGADGVQTNQPDAIVAAAGRPARARLEASRGEVCLVSAEHGLGFPGKAVQVRRGRQRVTVTTGLGGCADVPAWRGAVVTFTSDGSVRSTHTRLRR